MEKKSKFQPPGWLVYPLLIAVIVLAALYFFGPQPPSASAIPSAPPTIESKPPQGVTEKTTSEVLMEDIEKSIQEGTPRKPLPEFVAPSKDERRAHFIAQCVPDLKASEGMGFDDEEVLVEARTMPNIFCGCIFDIMWNGQTTGEQMSDPDYMNTRAIMCAYKTKERDLALY